MLTKQGTNSEYLIHFGRTVAVYWALTEREPDSYELRIKVTFSFTVSLGSGGTGLSESVFWQRRAGARGGWGGGLLIKFKSFVINSIETQCDNHFLYLTKDMSYVPLFSPSHKFVVVYNFEIYDLLWYYK